MQDLSEDELRKLWEQHRDSTDDAHAGTKSEILLALQKKKANLPDLTNLHMSKVDLCGADLTYLDLGGANFREAILIGTLFVQGDMVGTDFTQANLGGANFFDADVTEANFTKANLAKVDFTEVRAGGAVFHGRKGWKTMSATTSCPENGLRCKDESLLRSRPHRGF